MMNTMRAGDPRGLPRVVLVLYDDAGQELGRFRLPGAGAGSPAARGAGEQLPPAEQLPHVAELVADGRKVQVCPAGAVSLAGGGVAQFVCVRVYPEDPPRAAVEAPPPPSPRPSDPRLRTREAANDWDDLFGPSVPDEEGDVDALFL